MSDLTVYDDDESKSYNIMLPCTREDFSDFVSGLLSKGQIINARVMGDFNITKEELINIHNLINQRFTQQNEGSLIHFSVVISYDDFSSVEINSLEEFKMYAEVRDHLSHAITLTWIYLIKFNNRPVPEKQEIGITFRTKDEIKYNHYTDQKEKKYYDLKKGLFEVQIRHSARSWGVDIESLIVGHLETLKIPISKARKFAQLIHPYVGWTVAISIYAVSGAVIYLTMKSNSEERFLQFKESISSSENISLLSSFESLGSAVLSGAEARFMVATVFFSIIVLILGIFSGVNASEKTNPKRPSFLALTKKAELAMQSARATEGKFASYIFGTIFGSIAAGVIANLIFYYIFA